MPDLAPERQRRSARRPRPAYRRLLVAAGVLAALISAGSAYSLGYLVYLQGQIGTIPAGTTPPLPGKPFNVLILGSDSRAGLSAAERAQKGDTTTVPGHRADTIIMLRIDPATDQGVIVHFPRDLRVEIPGKGTDKINSAFEGGPKLMVKTIENFTGLTINHYIEVNFAGFEDLVNAMGGVPICVDRPLVDTLAELNLPKAGCYSLNGSVALAFVRARHVEGDLIPDFARIARQQQFIRALLNKALSPISAFKLPTIARRALKNLRVDEGLKVFDVKDIAKRLENVGSAKIDFRVVPSTPVTIGGIDYVEAIQPQTARMFRRMKEGKPLGNVGHELPATTLAATIKVTVLDAGGDASRVRRVLAKAGFDVGPIVPAPRVEGTRTAIVFRKEHEPEAVYVQNYLAALIGSIKSHRAEKGTLRQAEVGIVVGPDLSGSAAA